MTDPINQVSGLTPLEFELMSVLWEIAPASVREVQEHPSLDKKDLAYNTVQTMLNILVRKRKAERKKKGRAFVYEPVISKQQVASAATTDLVERLFEGSASRLVMSLLETRRLSPEQLEELRSLVEEETE